MLIFEVIVFSILAVFIAIPLYTLYIYGIGQRRVVLSIFVCFFGFFALVAQFVGSSPPSFNSTDAAIASSAQLFVPLLILFCAWILYVEKRK